MRAPWACPYPWPWPGPAPSTSPPPSPRQDLDAFAKTSYAYNGNLNKDGTGLSYSHWASEGDLNQNTYDLTVNGLFDLFNREHQVVFGFNGWDREANE